MIRSNINIDSKPIIDPCIKVILNSDNIFNVEIDYETGNFYIDKD